MPAATQETFSSPSVIKNIKHNRDMTQRHWIQNEKILFVTTNIHCRQPFFADDAYARVAVEVLYTVQELHPFLLYGFVIMPDHCHLLLRVPSPLKISNIIGNFKCNVTMNCGFKKLWQPRFHMQCAKEAHLALRYIHLNPVRAGLVLQPEDYPWSSASGNWEVTNLPMSF